MSEKQDIPTESPPPYSPPKHGWDAPESKPPPPPQYSASAPQAVTGGPSVYYPMNTPAPVGTAMYYPTNAQQGPVYPVGPTVVATNYFGRAQVRMACPYCTKEITSRTDKRPSMKAYISSAIICFLGCYLGCCLIPCCIDDCMSVEHRCPNCDKFLGRYEA